MGLLAAIDMDADYSMFELIANFSISIQLVVGCMSTVLSNGEKYHIRDFLDDASSHDHLYNNCIMEWKKLDVIYIKIILFKVKIIFF